MTRWVGLVCGLLMWVSCVSLPRPGKPALPDVQFRMRDFRLANGMRIIVEEDHASPLVGVLSVVGAGSSSDPAGREGLAHFLEHLAFRAAPAGRGTSWNQLEGAGVGFLNAQTWFDETTYMEVATKDLLPTMLSIEVGRLSNPLANVSPTVFDVEREVVRNELRQRGENAMGPAMSSLQQAAFPQSHHYARPIAGTHQSLQAITFDDAKAFAAKHYTPSNITMLIIGDVDLAHVHEVLAKALPLSVFQPLPPTREPYPGRLAGPQTQPPEPPVTPMLRTHSNVASPELHVVWSLPRSHGSETVLLDFVRAAANRELSAAAFSDPDILGVSVNAVPGAEASMLIATVSMHKGEHVDKTYQRVLDQLVKLWASGEAGREFSASAEVEAMSQEVDFIRQRNTAVMEMTLAAESLLLRGLERVRAAHYTGDPLLYTRRLHALADVTPSEVKHFAETYLRRERARAVLVEPYPPGSAELGPATTGLAPATDSTLIGTFSAEAVRQLGKAVSERAAFETVVRASPNSVEQTLETGLKVIIRKRDHSLPVVVVELVVPSSKAGTSPAGAGDLGALVARPRKHAYGAGSDYGIFWDTSVDDDRLTVTASGASGNVGNMLAQLSERVTSMHVDSNGLVFFKREFADALQRVEQLPPVRAEREIKAALFGHHPFGATATSAEMLTLSAGDVDGWFERALDPTHAVLVITGDLEVDKTMALAKQFLTGWSPPTQPFASAPTVQLRHDEAPVVVVTPAPSSSQANLHLACLSASSTELETHANETLAQLLGTEFFNKIRGELGASYGIGGRTTVMRGGVARLDWTGAIENARLGEALSVIHTAMKAFEAQTLTPQLFARARWSVARAATLNNATAEAFAGTLAKRALAGQAGSEVTEAFDSLAKLERGQVLEAWSSCQGNLVLGLSGDEALIRSALQAAGFSTTR